MEITNNNHRHNKYIHISMLKSWRAKFFEASRLAIVMLSKISLNLLIFISMNIQVIQKRGKRVYFLSVGDK